MLTSITLKNFKGFRDVTLQLGGLTTLVGANATGKSNIRDALRFLHGISRGYSLADIFGGHWSDQIQQWTGIRGGAKEAFFSGTDELTVTATIFSSKGNIPVVMTWIDYSISVRREADGKLVVLNESVYVRYVGNEERHLTFDSNPPNDPVSQIDSDHIRVRMPRGGNQRRSRVETLLSSTPVLTQLHKKLPEQLSKDRVGAQARKALETVIDSLRAIQFLDFNLDKMRDQSFPGQDELGDNGENLSSVLLMLCRDINTKAAIKEWIRNLTPMDAADFEFPEDQIGKVLVTLVEEDGRRISAYSASDGTLRFLAIMAALLRSKSPRTYFFEELDNGIHPTRIHLLLQLLRKQIDKGNVQVIATTHSPTLLNYLDDKGKQDASLVYRLKGSQESKIIPVLDIPGSADAIEKSSASRLMGSGWFETAVEFMDN